MNKKHCGLAQVTPELCAFAQSLGIDTWSVNVAEPYHMIIWELLILNGFDISRATTDAAFVLALEAIRPQAKHLTKLIRLDPKLRDAFIVAGTTSLIHQDDLQDLLAALIKQVEHKA